MSEVNMSQTPGARCLALLVLSFAGGSIVFAQGGFAFRTTITFPSTPVGETSTPQLEGACTVYLGPNTPDVTFGQLFLSGAGANSFQVVEDTCSSRTIRAPHNASDPTECCIVWVTFRPAAAGTTTAQLFFPIVSGTQPIVPGGPFWAQYFDRLVGSTPPPLTLEYRQSDAMLEHTGAMWRIFPERQSPNSPIERTVSLAIGGVAAGQQISIKRFDVDDPSTDPVVDPLGAGGGDNGALAPTDSDTHAIEITQQGTCTSSTKAIVTGSAPTCLVTFQVGASPGDNYRFAVTASQGLMASVTVNGEDLTRPQGVTVSDLLTVWRTLTVERRRMSRVDENWDIAVIVDVGTICGTAGCQSKLTLDRPVPTRSVGDVLLGTKPHSVIAPSLPIGTEVISIDGLNVIVSGQVPKIVIGSEVAILDDDDFNDNADITADNGPITINTLKRLAAGQGELLPYPDTSRLTSLLAPAYVRSKAVDAGDVQFKAILAAGACGQKIGAEATASLATANGLSQNRSDYFWLVSVVTGYQSGLKHCGHNDPWTLTSSIQRGVSLAANSVAFVSWVFVETIADMARSDVLGSAPNFVDTTAHEVVHQLGGCHEDGELMQRGGKRDGTLAPATIAAIRQSALMTGRGCLK